MALIARVLNSDFFAVRNSLLLIDNPVLYPAWFLHAKKGNKTIREIGIVQGIVNIPLSLFFC